MGRTLCSSSLVRSYIIEDPLFLTRECTIVRKTSLEEIEYLSDLDNQYFISNFAHKHPHLEVFLGVGFIFLLIFLFFFSVSSIEAAIVSGNYIVPTVAITFAIVLITTVIVVKKRTKTRELLERLEPLPVYSTTGCVESEEIATVRNGTSSSMKVYRLYGMKVNVPDRLKYIDTSEYPLDIEFIYRFDSPLIVSVESEDGTILSMTDDARF